MTNPSFLPERALPQLSEGIITTFSNRQRWTLRNGVPERLADAPIAGVVVAA